MTMAKGRGRRPREAACRAVKTGSRSSGGGRRHSSVRRPESMAPAGGRVRPGGGGVRDAHTGPLGEADAACGTSRDRSQRSAVAVAASHAHPVRQAFRRRRSLAFGTFRLAGGPASRHSRMRTAFGASRSSRMAQSTEARKRLKRAGFKTTGPPDASTPEAVRGAGTWEPAGLLGLAEGAPASMAAHSRRLGPAGPNGRRSGGEKSVCVCVCNSLLQD